MQPGDEAHLARHRVVVLNQRLCIIDQNFRRHCTQPACFGKDTLFPKSRTLDAVAICVIAETGEMLWQGKVLGDPDAVTAALQRWRDDLVRVGLEAGATSEWIGGHLVDEGFPVECLESRHVKAALGAMTVKTDQNDAQGIAQIVRTGWFKAI